MAKKPSHDLPDEDETPHRRRPHVDHDLPEPEAPAVDPHGILHPGDLPKPGEEVGIVQFENAAGGDNGRARYTAPPALRERTLTWRHQVHEQNHVNDEGHWVYRLTHTSGVGAVRRDPDLVPIDADDADPAPVVNPLKSHDA